MAEDKSKIIVRMTLEAIEQMTVVAYHEGFINGLRCYAWWKDGEQRVGGGVKTLKEAEANAAASDNFWPPRISVTGPNQIGMQGNEGINVREITHA